MKALQLIPCLRWFLSLLLLLVSTSTPEARKPRRKRRLLPQQSQRIRVQSQRVRTLKIKRGAKSPSADLWTEDGRSATSSFFQEEAWLSISEYKKLRKKALTPQELRSARIGEAEYKARYLKAGLQVTGTIMLETQGKGWHQISLLPTRYPIQHAKLNGKEARLITHRGRRSRVLIQGAGQHTLTLSFFVPRLAGPDPKVRLQFPNASISRFQVRFPGRNFRPQLPHGFSTKVQRNPKETILTTMLGYKRKGYILSWWESTQTQSNKKKVTKRQARTYAQTYSLLSVGTGGQELFYTVRYTIVHAPREQFRFLVPAHLQIRQVHCLGLRDYRLVVDKKTQQTTLEVLLTEPVYDRYEISILAEMKRKKGPLQLQLPQPLQVQRETGYLGVEVIGNDEIFAKPKGALTIDVQELPAEITRGTTRPILHAFRYTKRPASWTFRIQKHPNVSVPAATIDQAVYLLVTNPQGKTWIQATYQVRNTFKQFIAMTLPKGSEMQSAFVGGKPVKPAKDTKGRILIPLKRSGSTSGNTFRVETVYSLQAQAFRGSSLHNYALPQVDLWISTLQWKLYLPDGRVQWNTHQMRRRQSHHYATWTLKDFSVKKNAPSKPIPSAKPAIPALGGGKSIQIQLDGKTVGVLPVRIQLPRRGRSYTFFRYHLPPEEGNTLDFEHQPPWYGTFGFGFFLLCGLFLGFAITLGFLTARWKQILLLLPFLLSLFLGLIGIELTNTFSTDLVTLGAFFGMLVAITIRILLHLNQSKQSLQP